MGKLKEGMTLSCKFLFPAPHGTLSFSGICCLPVLSFPGDLSVRSALLISLISRFGPWPFPGCEVMLSPQLLQLSKLDRTLSTVVVFSPLLWPCRFTCDDSFSIICEGFQEEAERDTCVPPAMFNHTSLLYFLKEKDRS